MKPEALKGHLDAMLLAIVEQGPLHGYAVIDALRARSGGRLDLPTGTIYPALHRLERAGLVKSNWSIVSGRRRRSYQLTASGERALIDERSGWREFAASVNSILENKPSPAIP